MLIDCPICNINAEVEVIADYCNLNDYAPDEGQRYYFTKCPACLHPILMKSEIVYLMNSLEWSTSVRIFPSSDFYINPTVPKILQEALAESIKCFKGGSYTATAIMCRRTLEGFCEIKDVKEGDLSKSLIALKENGVINEQLYEWANQLRLTGNKAAHNINYVFSSEDARDILDFTVAILDFSYSYKEKFENFTKRHKKNVHAIDSR